jgi:hypothetical protein
MSHPLDDPSSLTAMSTRHRSWLGFYLVVIFLFGIAGGLIGTRLGPTARYTASGLMFVGGTARGAQPHLLAHMAELRDSAFITTIASATGISFENVSANILVTPIPESAQLRVGYRGRSAHEALTAARTIFAKYAAQADKAFPVTIAQQPSEAVRLPNPLGAVVTAGSTLLGLILGTCISFWIVVQRAGRRRAAAARRLRAETGDANL